MAGSSLSSPRRAFWSVLLGLLAGSSLPTSYLLAQPARSFHTLDGRTLHPAQLARTIRHLMDSARVPGLAVVLFEHNQVRYLRTFGYREVATHAALTPQTSMYGASLSKAVFAYVVMQLVQERVVDLDKPLAQYLPKPLPEYEAYRDLADDTRWQQVTARQALTHTTGLPNWRWLAPDKKLHFKFTPGQQYWYSGEGLQLLQFVLESVTQQSLVQLSETRVFQPLGMTHTSYVWQPAFEQNYALGYDEQGRPLAKRRRTSAGAAGSLETTPADYARFLSAVMQGKGLSAAAKQEMIRTQVRVPYRSQFGPLATVAAADSNRAIRLGYGLGWGTFESPYGHVYFKEGHDEGWENHSVVFSQAGKGLLLLSNSSNADATYMALLARLLGDRATPAHWENYAVYPPAAP